MDALVEVSRELAARDLERFGGNLPRYTSYPTAPQWKPTADPAALSPVWDAARASGRPLSMYVHIPFCRHQCWYCGCNQEVCRNEVRMDDYVDATLRHVDMLARRADGPLVQLHLGGGTPTHLPLPSLTRLCRGILERFPLAKGAEAAVEVHPGVTGPEHIRALVDLGFNRVSLGVQDFDPRVQRAVHRIQTYDQTAQLMAAAWDAGMDSVNVDLMYGLPEQTAERFVDTVDRVVALGPDRVAVFGYAHVPHMKPHQKLLQVDALPAPSARWTLFATALHRFVDAGYAHVGMDHFARPGDALADAREAGRLRRNFMGYTVAPESTLLAVGSSSIMDLGDAYVQHQPDADRYMAAVNAGVDPVVKTCTLSADDRLRRDIIQALFCQLEVDLDEVCVAHRHPEGGAFLARERARVQALAAEGLVLVDGPRVRVTPMGQVLLRQVASVFDAYLQPGLGGSYSQAV
jgi:oxygen-independent coproporphyrinogen-3 oxidase